MPPTTPPSPSLDLTAGFLPKAPGAPGTSGIDLSAGYVSKTQTPVTPPASIGPRDTSAGQWFRDVQSDMRYGGTSTLPGRLVHAMKGSPESTSYPGLPGGRNLDSGVYGGTSSGTAEFLGGPAIGPAVIGEGASQLSTHPVKGVNKIIRGMAQTAGPLVGAAVPGALPGAIAYGGAGQAVQGGLNLLGVDPDYSELAGNATSLLAPGGLPRTGRFLERNAGRIGKGMGVATGLAGAVEAARTSNPWWLATAGAVTDRATSAASKGVRGVGSMMQSMTPETGIPTTPAIPAPSTRALKAAPVELGSSTAPIDNSSEGLLKANRRVVRDPATGRMKLQYLTSSGGEVVRDNPASRLVDDMGGKPVETVTERQGGEDPVEAARRGAPDSTQSDEDKAYLQTLETKIADNAPDKFQAMAERSSLLNRMQGIVVDDTDLAAREQAGKTRNMSQPRAEVKAPTSTRKDLNLTPDDFLNARKLARTKAGAPPPDELTQTLSDASATQTKQRLAQIMQEGPPPEAAAPGNEDLTQILQQSLPQQSLTEQMGAEPPPPRPGFSRKGGQQSLADTINAMKNGTYEW